MSPSEYLKRYYDCRVSLPDETSTTVSITKYLNNGYTWTQHTKDALAAKDLLLQALKLAGQWSSEAVDGKEAHGFKLKGTYQSRFVSTFAILRPHMGKGSPGDIRDVIWALAFCLGVGREPIRRETSMQSIMRQIFGQNMSAKKPEELLGYYQKYCDKRVGLDCNGFLANYFGLPADTSVDAFANASRRLKSVSDVGPRSVLVWHRNKQEAGEKDWVHTSVIDSVESVHGNDVAMKIVESDEGLHEQRITVRFEQDRRGFLIGKLTGAMTSVDKMRHQGFYIFVSSPPSGKPRE